jgi:hypothetical protein
MCFKKPQSWSCIVRKNIPPVHFISAHVRRGDNLIGKPYLISDRRFESSGDNLIGKPYLISDRRFESSGDNLIGKPYLISEEAMVVQEEAKKQRQDSIMKSISDLGTKSKGEEHAKVSLMAVKELCLMLKAFKEGTPAHDKASAQLAARLEKTAETPN